MGIVARLVVGVLLGTLVGVLGGIGAIPSPGYAQDMSNELEEYKAICWDDEGWISTDRCIHSAEALGLEIDNLIESDRKGCKLENLCEDFSCVGPEYKGYEPISEEDSEESSSSDCLSVDAGRLSEEEVAVFQANGFTSDPTDRSEQLWSPHCVAGLTISELPEVTQQQMLNSEAYDVTGSSFEHAVIEYK